MPFFLTLAARRDSRFQRNVSLILLLLILFLITHGNHTLSHALANIGFLKLNQALANTPLDSASRPLTQAEEMLRQATGYAAYNHSAWWGLGFSLLAQGKENAAVHEWQAAGHRVNELIAWGRQAHTAGQYDEALLWYKRAIQSGSDLGDPWYLMGTALEAIGKYEEAAEAHRQGLQRARLLQVGWSNLYFHLGQDISQRSQTPDWQGALKLYDQALVIDDFSDDWSSIQIHYARGLALEQLNRKHEAVQAFEWVTVQHPTDYWAHIKFGSLTWQLYQDAEAAEKLIRIALNLDPHRKWAYRALGLVYQEQRQMQKAVEMYKTVLQLDPNDAFARQQLKAIGEGQE